MKWKRVGSDVFVCATLIGSIAGTAAAQEQWDPVGPDVICGDLDVVAPSGMWMIGQAGGGPFGVRRSLDGAETWTGVALPSDEKVSRLGMLDADRDFIMSSSVARSPGAHFLWTDDAGATFTRGGNFTSERMGDFDFLVLSETLRRQRRRNRLPDASLGRPWSGRSGRRRHGRRGCGNDGRRGGDGWRRRRMRGHRPTRRGAFRSGDRGVGDRRIHAPAVARWRARARASGRAGGPPLIGRGGHGWAWRS